MEWLEVIENVVSIIGTLAITAEAVLGPKKGPEKKAMVGSRRKGDRCPDSERKHRRTEGDLGEDRRG